MLGNSQFDQPIWEWNVSSVTSMDGMFAHSPFNQPIKEWDASKVTGMDYMFKDSKFNQPIEDWDVSSVSHMAEMFAFSEFSQPELLLKWDMDGKDSSNMFCGAFTNPDPSSVFASNIGRLGLCS